MTDPSTVDWNEPFPSVVARLEAAYLEIARSMRRLYCEALFLETEKRPFLWLPNPRTR